MACLDIDPSFRDVTTVPQLSTPYILALCARIYKHLVHTDARVNSGMLRSYVGRIHLYRKMHKARACVCVTVVYERAALPETFWEKSFPFPGSRHPPIAPVNFAGALRSRELFDYRVSLRVINRSVDFREGAIE